MEGFDQGNSVVCVHFCRVTQTVAWKIDCRGSQEGWGEAPTSLFSMLEGIPSPFRIPQPQGIEAGWGRLHQTREKKVLPHPMGYLTEN